MGIAEQRYRDNTGQRELKNGRTRCHAVSKTKVRLLRIERNDPTLRADDCWPEAQCSLPAENNTLLCELHGGASPNARKQSVSDWMPVDLREKLEILETNQDAIFNRDNEIKQLVARNAQLYESMEELVLGVEAYQAVAEARKSLAAGDIGAATILLEVALADARTEREVMTEIRENIKLLDKLTITQFTIREKLRLMATVEQVKSLLEGLYRGFEKMAQDYIPDNKLRVKAVQQFAFMLRQQANARHVSAELTDGK